MPGNTVKMVDEFRTSRMCARCFTPFPLNTLNDRFKVCNGCVPNQDMWPDGLKMPTKIVALKSKRMRRTEGEEMREALNADPNQDVGFVSKVICYRKNWRQNLQQYDVDVNNAERRYEDFASDYEPEDFLAEPDERILKTVWHRDITAAKLILYRGKQFIESEVVV